MTGQGNVKDETRWGLKIILEAEKRKSQSMTLEERYRDGVLNRINIIKNELIKLNEKPGG